MKNNVKYQTQRITVASGARSVTEKVVQIDASFDNVTGYNVHSVEQAAADKFSLGLIDRTGVLHDRTFESDHIASTSVSMKERYKDLSAKAGGNQITVQIEPVAELTSNLVVDVVFRLEKDHKNCN